MRCRRSEGRLIFSSSLDLLDQQIHVVSRRFHLNSLKICEWRAGIVAEMRLNWKFGSEPMLLPRMWPYVGLTFISWCSNMTCSSDEANFFEEKKIVILVPIPALFFIEWAYLIWNFSCRVLSSDILKCLRKVSSRYIPT